MFHFHCQISHSLAPREPTLKVKRFRSPHAEAASKSKLEIDGTEKALKTHQKP